MIRQLLRRRIPVLLLAVFLMGIGAGWITGHFFPGEDFLFRRYTREIFENEICSNTLNLHYTLAHPEKRGLKKSAVSLGKIAAGDAASYSLLENYEKGLRRFDSRKLSEKEQITYDTLLLYFHTLREGSEYEYLNEVLSPGLGIQAQLPILLAEYTFYDREDVEDYLALLEGAKTYFRSILEFEQEKAARGYFMRDDCLEEVLAQCRDFVKNPEENYLIDIFCEKINALSFLKERAKKDYIDRHRRLITEQVIPAYQSLIEGLSVLKGSGTNDMGLCYFPEGKDYYIYLLKTQVGVYESPAHIRQRLQTQLSDDYAALDALLRKHPDAIQKALRCGYRIESPEKALRELEKASQKDFPALGSPDFSVKYVHRSLENYLSPAFYLTPPIDEPSTNDIYINNASQTTDIELFATLGHEGFPGHLYQSQYFLLTEPDDVRHAADFGGYVEGWATYVESYAYSYANVEESVSRLLWLNRSINLCLSSLTDIGIHYYGWSQEDVSRFLAGFGISGERAAGELYRMILENPANYLKYYVGYLNFLDLKTQLQSIEGDRFDLKEFHRRILEIGPTQFPVLRKYMGLSLH